jgi:hypothetical protein
MKNLSSLRIFNSRITPKKKQRRPRREILPRFPQPRVLALV